MATLVDLSIQDEGIERPLTGAELVRVVLAETWKLLSGSDAEGT